MDSREAIQASERGHTLDCCGSTWSMAVVPHSMMRVGYPPGGARDGEG